MRYAIVVEKAGDNYSAYAPDLPGCIATGNTVEEAEQEEDYLLGCQRYIELNPVRANMVAHPAEYRWSSYRANAQGEADALVQPHPLYAALGSDAPTRQDAYRELFRYELEPGMVDEIRRATNGNFALGSERFAAAVAEMIGRRASPGQSGRPRKSAVPESGEFGFE